MVAYQAESDLLALLRSHYARVEQEERTLLHELFASAGMSMRSRASDVGSASSALASISSMNLPMWSDTTRVSKSALLGISRYTVLVDTPGRCGTSAMQVAA
jgi:hypothetical protein